MHVAPFICYQHTKGKRMTYNRRTIMLEAWEIVRGFVRKGDKRTIPQLRSQALKSAWYSARQALFVARRVESQLQVQVELEERLKAGTSWTSTPSALVLSGRQPTGTGSARATNETQTAPPSSGSTSGAFRTSRGWWWQVVSPGLNDLSYRSLHNLDGEKHARQLEA